jgi:hypothetical protein
MSNTEVIEASPVKRTEVVATASPQQLLTIAVQRGASIDELDRLMDLQERFEAREARKAYTRAFAAFKAEAIRIVKNKQVTDGPLRNKRYAELFVVVNAVTPALSEHGLSLSWETTKDHKDWIEVTCYLRHEAGHFEKVSMGGPPDTGGAKNAIQARASTTTYLQRYTARAILGLAEQDEDDDGDGGAMAEDWINDAAGAKSLDALQAIRKAGTKAYEAARDREGYKAFARAVKNRAEELQAGAEKEPAA